MLVGNKCDLESQRQVTFEQGKDFADSLGVKFIETSAKNSINVEKAFFTLAEEIKSKVSKGIRMGKGIVKILKKRESRKKRNIKK